MDRIAFTVALAFVLTMAGCDPFENEGRLMARAALMSTAEQNQSVSFELENGTSASVYFRSCCADVGFYIEQLENGNWKRIGSQGLECPVSGGIVIRCAIEPLSLEPGESYTGQASILDGGEYRLVFPYGSSHKQSNASIVRTNPLKIE